MAAIILHFIPMTSENSLLFSFVIHMRQTQLARDLRLKIGHDIELTFRIVILGRPPLWQSSLVQEMCPIET